MRILLSRAAPPDKNFSIALGLLLIPAYYHLKRNMIRYTLTDSKMEIDYGLIARTTRNIPLAANNLNRSCFSSNVGTRRPLKARSKHSTATPPT